MTKKELIEQLAVQNPTLTQKKIKLSVQIILDSMSSYLQANHRVEIRGFGSFVKRLRAPWTARNPKTGACVLKSETPLIHFKPGKEMRILINQRNMEDV